MDQVTAERIYIGGLNPPQLSASDILQRIKAMDHIEISASEAKDSKPYLHMEVVSKDPNRTALDIITKQYHNVKWKGCKVVVEAARPHLLERLEEERHQRDMQSTPSGSEMGQSLHCTSNLPRRLRVRKKFGEEAFHIDTKPWLIDDWSDFHTARSKLEKRAEKYHLQQKEAKRQNQQRNPVLLHRAVHIRFQPKEKSTDSTSSGDEGGSRTNLRLAKDSQEEVIGSESGSSNSDNAASPSSEGGSEEESKKMEKTYEWSDSDDASDDDDDEQEGSENANSSTNIAQKTLSNQSDDSENVAPSEESSHSEEAVPDAQVEQQGSDKAPELDTYLWSSDDDSSDDETQFTEKIRDFLNPVEASAADEFAAGLDDEEIMEDSENIMDDNTHEPSQQQETDLKDDVLTNLDILSSLFPDMDTVRPAHMETDKNSGASDKSKAATTLQKATIIPRYDPSSESSKKYTVVEDATPKKEESEDSPNESSAGDASKEGISSEEDDDRDQAAPIPEAVYEQDKLESVFRSARDVWDQKASIPAADTKEQANGGFAFGFALGESNDNNAPSPQEQQTKSGDASSGFSFGFDLASDDPARSQRSDSMNESKPNDTLAKVETAENAQVGEATGEAVTGPRLPRRRGFQFPEEDLSRYVGYFFSIDDDSVRRQDGVDDREVWNRERHSLTLDWKRKRKYAMSRIQKRLKIR